MGLRLGRAAEGRLAELVGADREMTAPRVPVALTGKSSRDCWIRSSSMLFTFAAMVRNSTNWTRIVPPWVRCYALRHTVSYRAWALGLISWKSAGGSSGNVVDTTRRTLTVTATKSEVAARGVGRQSQVEVVHSDCVQHLADRRSAGALCREAYQRSGAAREVLHLMAK